MNYDDITTLAIALGFGLLIGLQREKTQNRLAGVRTFSLLSLMGVFSGFFTRDLDNPFVLPLIGLAIAGLLISGNILAKKIFQIRTMVKQQRLLLCLCICLVRIWF